MEMLEKESFDAVMTDVIMPRMNGIDLIRRIRRTFASSLPILVITALDTEQSRFEACKAGADSFLTKPYDPQEVLRWLEERMKNQSRDSRNQARVSAEASPAQTDTIDSPLDQTVLDRIRSLQRGGQPNILKTVVDIYLQNSAKLLETLRGAIAESDASKIRETAHRLKSCSASLGAVTLASLCEEFEARGRWGRTDGAPDMLRRLEGEYRAVCNALAAETGTAAA